MQKQIYKNTPKPPNAYYCWYV